MRTVLDVGSRDGLVASDLKQHFPNAIVFAFECNPDVIELVQRNIAGQRDVHLVKKAISDTNGPLSFYAIDPVKTITPRSDGNIGASSLYVADFPNETYVQNKISVDGIRLEDWAKTAGVSSIDIVWMDVQGAELQALHGLGDLLGKVAIIQVEVEYKSLYQEQPLAGEVRAYLRQYGFDFYRAYNVSEWFGDEMFVRRDLWPWWERLVKRKAPSLSG